MSTSIAKRVGEVLILGVYLAVDAIDIWPKSHVGCLIIAFIGVIGILLLDGMFEQHLPIKRIVIIGAIAALACVAVYFGAPVFENETASPSPKVVAVPEGEVTGVLEPGNLPTPHNACSGARDIPQDALKIMIGSNTYVAPPSQTKITAIQIGSCPVLTMEKTPQGIQVGANLYGAAGNLIARIDRNGFRAISGPKTHVERGNDLSTLIVRDETGSELLHVHYLNPTTLQASGIFGCPGHPLIRAMEGAPIAGIWMENICAAALSGIAIKID